MPIIIQKSTKDLIFRQPPEKGSRNQLWFLANFSESRSSERRGAELAMGLVIVELRSRVPGLLLRRKRIWGIEGSATGVARRKPSLRLLCPRGLAILAITSQLSVTDYSDHLQMSRPTVTSKSSSKLASRSTRNPLNVESRSINREHLYHRWIVDARIYSLSETKWNRTPGIS